MGNSVDWCAVCVTFVALFAVVLVVCEGPFEVVAMLSAAGLMLITSLVMFVLLNLSWGLLAIYQLCQSMPGTSQGQAGTSRDKQGQSRDKQ